MIKVAAIGAVLAATFGLWTSAASAREIKVGTDCTYPPFGYREASGELKGYDIDIAREIGKRMGADLTFVCQAFDGMLPGLMAGKFDLVVASLSITDERKKSIDFSVPYRSASARFIGPKAATLNPMSADGKPNPAALKGKVIGIQRATTYEKYLTASFPGVELGRYDTVDNMLLDLKAGRIDLAFGGPIKLSADFLEKPQGKDFGFVGPEIDDVQAFGPGIGVGLRKNEPEMLNAVNAALKGMFDDGTFKAINQRYWQFSVLPSVWNN
jgi:lysine-arginine-ornithine-binding protein